jgi:hypothetical protein
VLLTADVVLQAISMSGGEKYVDDREASRWSINYYNDTANAVGRAPIDAQKAGGGLGDYYTEHDTCTPAWLCAGDNHAAANLVGLTDALRKVLQLMGAKLGQTFRPGALTGLIRADRRALTSANEICQWLNRLTRGRSLVRNQPGPPPKLQLLQSRLSHGSVPDRHRTMPNVTVWKRCGAAW